MSVRQDDSSRAAGDVHPAVGGSPALPAFIDVPVLGVTAAMHQP